MLLGGVGRGGAGRDVAGRGASGQEKVTCGSRSHVASQATLARRLWGCERTAGAVCMGTSRGGVGCRGNGYRSGGRRSQEIPRQGGASWQASLHSSSCHPGFPYSTLSAPIALGDPII